MPLFGHLLLTLFLLLAFTAQAEERRPVYIGLDGEFGLINSTSAQAIEKGIRIALHEINAAGGVLRERPLKLLTRDNRSVPARGKENIRQFAQVKDLVAVIGGRFSPVILEELALVHRLGIVLLDPWGAADGITDHGHQPSYSFRLSLKDSYAMPVMLQHARSKGAKRVGILVPNTGWGRSSAKAAQRLQKLQSDISILKPVWYNWGEKEMLRHYLALQDAGADAIIMVANDIEGSVLVRQLEQVEADKRLPIISHWGVTGGKMVENSGPLLNELDFSVVQSFSLFNAEPDKRDQVMTIARELFNINTIEEVASPVGLGHAYDLTHILARAVDIAGSTNRNAIRDALERVKDYRGLTGNYPRPFSAENHDAMKPEQVFMARYRKDGAIVPLSEIPTIE
ncbi:MAG: ABC transporter substrate-binding protein [Pseudomonadota bacterium]